MHTVSKTPEKVRQYRKRMQEAGLRPIQLWTWDTRSPKFADAIRFQCQRLKEDPAEAEILGFGEAAASLIEDWR